MTILCCLLIFDARDRVNRFRPGLQATSEATSQEQPCLKSLNEFGDMRNTNDKLAEITYPELQDDREWRQAENLPRFATMFKIN